MYCLYVIYFLQFCYNYCENFFYCVYCQNVDDFLLSEKNNKGCFILIKR